MQPQEIEKAIASKEGCVCSFSHAVNVTEKFKGQTVWDGSVLVYNLSGHKAKHCYAWVDPSNNQLVTVLEFYPVQSPETAVRAYIASRAKPKL
ncbi:MAG: hypothetical protein R3F23_01805 [Verrucomicrobiia bacterium]